MRVGTRRSPVVTKATTTRTIERSAIARRVLPFVVWAVACAPHAASPPVAPKAAVRAIHRGPLGDLVAAAGLRWLVLARPRQILADAELGPAIFEIVPARRFDAFEESSGVDLRALPSAVIAGFPYSTLYLAEVSTGVAARARAAFADRLLAGAAVRRSHPALIRITGVVGQTPETLLTVDDRALVVAVGDPLQAKVAEAYAEERLKSSPSALRGAALSSLPDLYADNAAVLLAPGPFSDEWQRAAGGLLKSSLAVAIAGHPNGQGEIATTICLSGAWGESAGAAASRMSAAWTVFARSAIGQLFALPEAAEVTATRELLTLHVTLGLAPLVRGLRASVLGDLTQILNLPGRAPPEPAPRN